MKNGEENSVWYASYGSNISETRFRCYIAGGKPEGSRRTYAGCANKSFPKASKPICINRELYFARKSKTWNGGGVGFLSPNPDKNVRTLGRMYLITSDQFSELVQQECRYISKLRIDFNQLIRDKEMLISEKSWYGNLVFLGYESGKPVFTFTNKDFITEEFNPPDIHYLRIIIKGLKETYKMADAEIKEYLETKKGIKNSAIEPKLTELITRK